MTVIVMTDEESNINDKKDDDSDGMEDEHESKWLTHGRRLRKRQGVQLANTQKRQKLLESGLLSVNDLSQTKD